MEEFTVKVTLPSGKTVRVPEIKNKNYITILKYCENLDGEGLTSFFFNNIYKEFCDLDVLDKFYLLLASRMLFIDPDLTFTTKEQRQVNMPVHLILSKIDHFDGDFTKIYTFDNLTLELGLPTALFFKDTDDIYISSIKKIIIKDKVLDFGTLTEGEKNEILSNIPSSIFNILISHINSISEQLSDFIIIDKNESLDIKEININLLSNGLISFILSIYSASLTNFFELIYIFANRLHLTQESFFNMTPLDARVILNIYNKDIEEREKELKKQEQM